MLADLESRIDYRTDHNERPPQPGVLSSARLPAMSSVQQVVCQSPIPLLALPILEGQRRAIATAMEDTIGQADSPMTDHLVRHADQRKPSDRGEIGSMETPGQAHRSVRLE